MEKLMIEIQIIQTERKISLLEIKFLVGFAVFIYSLLALFHIRNTLTLVEVSIPVLLAFGFLFLRWIKSYIGSNYELKNLKNQQVQHEFRRKSWSQEGSFFVFRRD